MDFANYAIAGVPLILIVFAIVEELKAYGLTGKILRLASLLVGFILTLALQISIGGTPIGFGSWFTVVIVGLIYGLTASGAYDFLDARFPVKTG